VAISNLRDATEEEIQSELEGQADHVPMAWRYLPGVSGFGCTTSEPTVYPSQNEFTSVRIGEGSIAWHELTWEQNPTQFHIANALAALPILEQKPALVTTGATNLILLDRLPRGIS
jgi:acetoacetate decarboxylase